jgi:hypothetical protein
MKLLIPAFLVALFSSRMALSQFWTRCPMAALLKNDGAFRKAVTPIKTDGAFRKAVTPIKK